MSSGANMPAIGSYNRAVVLDAIRRRPDGISRVELASQTGLSAQTITNLARQLIERGFIRESGTEAIAIGKPRRLLNIRSRGAYALGVHIDPSVVTLVLLDLAGAVVAHTRGLPPQSPSQTVDDIARMIDDLLLSAHVDRDDVLGVGVATPGPIDASTGVVINPPLLRHWQQVPVRDMLLTRLNMPVLFEKDVTAAAVAHTWSDLDMAAPNALFFYFGTGTGVGLIVGGEVVRGVSGNAGDWGSLPLHGAATAGAHTLGELMDPRRLLHLDALPGTRDELTEVVARLRELSDRAQQHDADALAMCEATVTGMTSALVTLINLLDLNHVIFGGPFWPAVSTMLLPRVSAALNDAPQRVTRDEISFSSSPFGEDVVAIGAAALVLDTLVSPRPEALLIVPGRRD